jgi:3-hydroxyisobutyrate dehydrogenase
MSKKIGIVGVGRMGANMARRLKECGYKVTAVYDVNRQDAASISQEIGAEVCTKLARVTELSDVIITVVTDDKAQLSIFTRKKDNLLIGAKGRAFINCATVSPKTHVQVEKLAKQAGASSLEACMASSNHCSPNSPTKASSCATSAPPAKPRKSRPSSTW